MWAVLAREALRVAGLYAEECAGASGSGGGGRARHARFSTLLPSGDAMSVRDT
jgi:hypothetical protein